MSYGWWHCLDTFLYVSQTPRWWDTVLTLLKQPHGCWHYCWNTGDDTVVTHGWWHYCLNSWLMVLSLRHRWWHTCLHSWLMCWDTSDDTDETPWLWHSCLHSSLVALLLRHGWWHCWNTQLMTLLFKLLVDVTFVETRLMTLLKHPSNDTSGWWPFNSASNSIMTYYTSKSDRQFKSKLKAKKTPRDLTSWLKFVKLRRNML